MGDMADDFRAMKQIRKERRERIEPQRVKAAIKKLNNIGCSKAEYNAYSKCIFFTYKHLDGRFFPYTG